jgi:hypothetical protein
MAAPTTVLLTKGGLLMASVSSPEVEEEQEDRCSAGDLKEPPVADTIGQTCQNHLPKCKVGLGQDYGLSPP